MGQMQHAGAFNPANEPVVSNIYIHFFKINIRTKFSEIIQTFEIDFNEQKHKN
jgi:hypothetical protein